jgi:hypothetical protein
MALVRFLLGLLVRQIVGEARIIDLGQLQRAIGGEGALDVGLGDDGRGEAEERPHQAAAFTRWLSLAGTATLTPCVE